jgi:hypothetical protein
MDPITASLFGTLGTAFLKDIFSPAAPAGPTQAQILAMLQRQQQQQAQQRNAWLIGGGLVAVGLVAFMLVSRK